MHTIHQISPNKYGVEFPILTLKKKKISILTQMLQLFIKDTDIIVSYISGLDFNVEKVISSIQPKVLEFCIEEGICNTKFMFCGIQKLKFLMQFCDMFSEGSFGLYTLNREDVDEKLDISAELNIISKIAFTVNDDGTYFEISLKNDMVTDDVIQKLFNI